MPCRSPSPEPASLCGAGEEGIGVGAGGTWGVAGCRRLSHHRPGSALPVGICGIKIAYCTGTMRLVVSVVALALRRALRQADLEGGCLRPDQPPSRTLPEPLARCMVCHLLLYVLRCVLNAQVCGYGQERGHGDSWIQAHSTTRAGAFSGPLRCGGVVCPAALGSTAEAPRAARSSAWRRI